MSGGGKQRIDQNPDHQHAGDVAQIRILDPLEGFFGETQGADEAGCGHADQAAKERIKQKCRKRGGRCRSQQRIRDRESRMSSEENAADEGRGAGSERDRQERPRA